MPEFIYGCANKRLTKNKVDLKNKNTTVARRSSENIEDYINKNDEKIL